MNSAWATAFMTKLGDPVATADFVRGDRVCVDEKDPELVAVASIDEPRGVQHRDAVAKRQAAAGLYEAGVALRDGESHAR